VLKVVRLVDWKNNGFSPEVMMALTQRQALYREPRGFAGNRISNLMDKLD